jgi:hypoxanthine phosphoribosyltransferase
MVAGMSENSYDYSHRQGILPISWDDMHGLCKGLARAISAYDPHMVLGVARGGLYPGTLIAHMLQKEFYPIRLSRRVDDVVVHAHPQWHVPPPESVAGKRVLVVDEIVSTGETVRAVRDRVLDLGAADVRVAVLYAHTWGTGAADYIGQISDALILNPWDREIFLGGEFCWHPEYVDAMARQGLRPDRALLIRADEVAPAKG